MTIRNSVSFFASKTCAQSKGRHLPFYHVHFFLIFFFSWSCPTAALTMPCWMTGRILLSRNCGTRRQLRRRTTYKSWRILAWRLWPDEDSFCEETWLAKDEHRTVHYYISGLPGVIWLKWIYNVLALSFLPIRYPTRTARMSSYKYSCLPIWQPLLNAYSLELHGDNKYGAQGPLFVWHVPSCLHIYFEDAETGGEKMTGPTYHVAAGSRGRKPNRYLARWLRLIARVP